MSEQLLKVLPPRYEALLAKRYVLHRSAAGLMSLPEEHRAIYPVVHVAQAPRISEVAVACDTRTVAPPAARRPGDFRDRPAAVE